MSVTFVLSAFADTKTEEEDPPSSSRKGKAMEKKPGGEENSKRPTSPITSSNKAQLSMNRPVYKVGPPSWIKKEISGCTLWKRLVRTMIYLSHTYYLVNVMTTSMPRRCLDRWIDRLLEHEPNWSAKENSCI